MTADTPIALAVLLLGYARPRELQAAISRALEAIPEAQLFVSVDGPRDGCPEAEFQARAESLWRATEAANDHRRISVFAKPTNTGIRDHISWAVDQLIRQNEFTHLVLLEDDQLLTRRGAEFLARQAQVAAQSGQEVLASAFTYHEHALAHADAFRTTVFPTLWGVVASRQLVELAVGSPRGHQLPGLLSIWRLMPDRLSLTDRVLASAFLLRTLQIGQRSRDHFDAVLLGVALGQGVLPRAPAGTLLIDLGGGVQSYSGPRECRSSPCGAQVTYDGRCSACEVATGRWLAAQGRQALKRKLTQAIRVPGTPGGTQEGT